MAALTWTAEAERWLRDICDYIALDNPNAAARTIEAIKWQIALVRLCTGQDLTSISSL